MKVRTYQVATLVHDDPDYPQAARVHFAAVGACPIELSRQLAKHRIAGDKVVWWRWK